MNDAKKEAKILKLAAKRKSDAIIKMLDKGDPDVVACCLNALATINDEDSFNTITRYLEDSISTIKLAACKAAIVIDTDYMKTHVRHAVSKETDPTLKQQMLDIMNASK